MANVGRPTKYTEELADYICEGIASGDSLMDLLERRKDAPAYETVMRWLREDKHDGFRVKYARAREDQGDWYADRIADIARACENPVDRTKVEGARVSIDGYKWLAGKRKPKVYGDLQKLEHSGSGGAPLKITIERPNSEADD